MTTEDLDFARKIATYLDRGAADLKTGTAYRLQLARGQALARLASLQHAPESQLALSGAGTGTVGPRGLRSGGRYGIAILVVLAALFGVQQWQAYQQVRDLEETDAAILSSDLPIDAYLDRGFQNWLKRVSDDD